MKKQIVIVMILMVALVLVITACVSEEQTVEPILEANISEVEIEPITEPYEFIEDTDDGVLADMEVKANAIVFTPSDMYGLVYAKLNVEDGEVSFTAIINDDESLNWLKENFGSAKKSDYKAGCPFWSAMYLTRADGTVGVIYPALDSCKVFLSGDTQYTWGSGDNDEFFALFGATDYESLIAKR